MIGRVRGHAVESLRLGREALQWWFGELLAFVPSRWRNRNVARIEIQLGHPTAALRLLCGTQISEAGYIDLQTQTITPASFSSKVQRLTESLPIWLYPPSDAVLKRIIQLPRSAFANFARLLPLEVERWTPYRLDEIAIAWKQIGQSAKTIDIELRYIPRKPLIELTTSLIDAGIIPSRIVLGPDKDFNVAATEFRSSDKAARVRTKRIALGALAFGALSFLSADWWVAEETRRAWQEQVKQEAHALSQQRSLQKRIADIVGATKSSGELSPMRSESLALLARALPSTDWLTEVSFRDQTVTLRGYSANPDLLLKQLEPLAMDKEVSLQGEMALDAKLARQRFALTIQIARGHR